MALASSTSTGGFNPAASAVPGIPSWQATILEQLSAQNKLSGVPAWVLGLIAKEESGFEDAGAAVNSSNYGGYFGLSTGTVSASVLNTNSEASFTQQAPLAAAIFAQGLKASGGNIPSAENYYQTGKVGSSSGGSKLFSEFMGGALSGSQVTSSAPGGSSGGSSSTTPTTGPTACAWQGPLGWCILSNGGVDKLMGALLMTAGGLVLTVGLALVVVGAIAETKVGKTASKALGATGLGAVAGVATAPARAVGQRRTQRAATTQRAAATQATQTHQTAIRRAQLRTARARARRSEEGVRTQRAVTQGRQDSGEIRSYKATEGKSRRQEAVESRSAGARLTAQNKRRLQQRQKFHDVFGETG